VRLCFLFPLSFGLGFSELLFGQKLIPAFENAPPLFLARLQILLFALGNPRALDGFCTVRLEGLGYLDIDTFERVADNPARA
jgi:hypothetical protein